MVSFQLDFATIASILAVLMGVATLTGFAVKEGERRETLRKMREELDDLYAEKGKVREQAEFDGRLLAGIQATLNSLVASVGEVRSVLMQHIGRDQGGGG